MRRTSWDKKSRDQGVLQHEKEDQVGSRHLSVSKDHRWPMTTMVDVPSHMFLLFQKPGGEVARKMELGML